METTQENNSQLYKRLEALTNKAGEAFDNEKPKEAKDLAEEVIDLYEEGGVPKDCNNWAGRAHYIVGRCEEEKDYNGTMAYIHYMQAVELGNNAAYTELGQLFYDGNGVTPDGAPAPLTMNPEL